MRSLGSSPGPFPAFKTCTLSSRRAWYRMAGNFRGVLILLFFVVDLSITKFSTHEINAYSIRGALPCQSIGSVSKQQSLLSSSWWRICLVLFLHADFFCRSGLRVSDKGNQARSRAHINSVIFSAAPHPWTWLLSRNLKSWKLILRAFSDFPRKPALPKNYQPYGIRNLVTNIKMINLKHNLQSCLPSIIRDKRPVIKSLRWLWKVLALEPKND